MRQILNQLWGDQLLKELYKDSHAQAIPIEYILIFSMATLFFGIMIMSFSSVMDNSSRQGIYTEFMDIGNQVSSTITSAYISTPIEGQTVSVIEIPVEVANTAYFIEITEENPYEEGQKALRLQSMHKDVTVYVPLSCVDELVYVNGSASSSSGKIIINSNDSGIYISQG
jgi:hypothetical protein